MRDAACDGGAAALDRLHVGRARGGGCSTATTSPCAPTTRSSTAREPAELIGFLGENAGAGARRAARAAAFAGRAGGGAAARRGRASRALRGRPSAAPSGSGSATASAQALGSSSSAGTARASRAGARGEAIPLRGARCCTSRATPTRSARRAARTPRVRDVREARAAAPTTPSSRRCCAPTLRPALERAGGEPAVGRGDARAARAAPALPATRSTRPARPSPSSPTSSRPARSGTRAAVAELAEAAAWRLGWPSPTSTPCAAPALLHDLGRVGVLQRASGRSPAPLERGRVGARAPAPVLHRARAGAVRRRWPSSASVAARHHERLDGSGYHRGAARPATLRAPRACSPPPTSARR